MRNGMTTRPGKGKYMKSKLALAACLAALALPAAPAAANEAIPGTCYETRVSRYTGITRSVYACECLVSAWPEVQGSDVVFTWCHAGDPIIVGGSR